MGIISHDQVPALDASFRTIRTLADGPSGRTELVRSAAGEVLVRKVIPLEIANVHAWMTLTRVESPLLPGIDSLYERDGNLVVVLSYVDGVTLGEMVESTGALGVAESARYLAELCEAVGVLHAHGIVHRDLSPSNVVVAGGSPRIIDLGNARVHEEGARKDTTVLGTYGFAAPEQFGFAQTDARSDVYSLGSLLGYMLTGVRPDDQGFDAALADVYRVPTNLRLVVEKARAFEPSARFQSAAELSAAVRAAVGDMGRRGLNDLGGRVLQDLIEPSSWRYLSNEAIPPSVRVRAVSNWGLKLIASWAFFLFWVICFISVGKDYWTGTEFDLPTRLYTILSSVTGAIANVVMAVETHHAIRLEGRYSATEDVKKELVRRLRTIALIALAIIILLASISVFFS